MFSLPDIQEMVTKMSKNHLYKSALNEISTLPPLRVKSLKQLNPRDICTHLERARGIGRRRRASANRERQDRSLSWGKNECLVFEWLALCHCYAQQVPI